MAVDGRKGALHKFARGQPTKEYSKPKNNTIQKHESAYQRIKEAVRAQIRESTDVWHLELEKKIQQDPFHDKASSVIKQPKAQTGIEPIEPEIMETGKYAVGDSHILQEPTIDLDKASGCEISMPPEHIHADIQ